MVLHFSYDLINKYFILFNFFLKQYIYNMSFASEASKLLTNKFFLYFIVFLAATNILGYLVTNKINAVIFFALVSLLTYQFSKNMAVILLVALIATNFLIANKKMREGLDNQSSSTPSSGSKPQALNNIESKDSDIANYISVVENSKNNSELYKQLENKKSEESTVSNLRTKESNNNKKSNHIPPVMDVNNPDKNISNDNTGPEGFGEKMTVKKNYKSGTNDSRIDYATTIEQSYANLDNLLGSDSIKQLTTDTQKLMKQQQNLFETMNNMVPVLEGAKNLLKDFKIGSLSESLKNIGNIAIAPIAGNPKGNV
jgi:hypothetical protein